jgi:hypothetical protein
MNHFLVSVLGVVSDAVERSNAPRHLVFSSTRLLHLTSLG